jgi:glycosyltransferase involved in cell wall biosynthesis
VVPSLVNEALPRVVIEAFAYGVPVLGTDRGGIREQIDQGSGRLFDPDDVASLACLLQELIKQPRQLVSLGRGAQARAKDFSPDAMLDGYLAAYAEALLRARKSISGAS